MDLLTKYRPIRSLEFYQRKALGFIYSAESSDDLRSLGIPYGLLGFESPFHFIRCIPSGLCKDYQNDRFFEIVDKSLRKGCKVFLTSEDGKIQSAVYKAKKISKSGEFEVILDGHRSTYPIDKIVPYKQYLRDNVGMMLEDGPDKVVGSIVDYVEAKWICEEAIYYKPSKRWGTIDERQIYSNGKIYCKVKLEQTKMKKEKVIRVSLPDLMVDGIPYRIPIIPKNNANVKEINIPHKKVEIETKENKILNTPTSSVSDSTFEEKTPTRQSKDRYKLIRQKSQEQNETNKINVKERNFSTPSVETPTEVSFPQTPRKATASQSSEDGIVCLAKSPRMSNDYTDAPTVKMRSKIVKPSMRPLTEYFHSKSVEAKEDYQPLESSNFRSVNNLTTQPSSDEEDLGLENYTSSLRRSARNVLARQVADQALLRTSMKKRTSASTDNLISEGLSSQQPIVLLDYKSIPSLLKPTQGPRSLSQNETTPSDSDSSHLEMTQQQPPPLPNSRPPQPQIYQSQPQIYQSQPRIYLNENIENPHLIQSPSVVERYFVSPTSLSEEERAPRNYENSNFQYFHPNQKHNHHHGQHPPLQTASSSEISNTLQQANSGYSLTDIPNFIAQHEDEVYPHEQQNQNDYEDPYNNTIYHEQHPQTFYSDSINIRDHKADFVNNHVVDIQNYLYSKDPLDGEYEQQQADDSLTLKKSSRYKKNPSAVKQFQKIKSVPNMEEMQKQRDFILPKPFTSQNIHSAVGKGRGIQAGYNSFYVDVSLFAFFYCSNIFDKLLLQDIEGDKGMKQEIKGILRQKICKPLRLAAFCSRESVTHLREALLPLSSKLNGSFMDPEEFIYLLFENALNLPEFIHYSNNTSDFMHQIVIKPKDRKKCQNVQILFETSLEINDLKIRDHVILPALMLCMPRCNGRLSYYDAVVPNMSLNITSLVSKGPKKCLCEMAATLECALCYKRYGEVSLAYCQTCQRLSEQIHYHIGHDPVLIPKQQSEIILNLLAVICIRANHYSVFVKSGIERYAPWLYFEATPTEHPQVIVLEDFGRWLDKLEREPERYREFAKMNGYLKRIMTEAHICIYFSPEAIPSPNHSESFMI